MVTDAHLLAREEQRRNIIRLFEAGETQKRIAISMGLTSRYVARVLNESGNPNVARELNSNQQLAKRNAQLIQDRANGMTMEAIGKKYKISGSSVSDIINRYAPANIRRMHLAHIPLTYEQKQEIFALRRNRKSYEEISKLMGISSHRISRLLKSTEAPDDIRGVNLTRTKGINSNRADILRLFADGLSYKRISDVFGISQNKVKRITNSAGGWKDTNGTFRIRSAYQMENANRRLWELRDIEQELIDLRLAKTEYEDRMM